LPDFVENLQIIPNGLCVVAMEGNAFKEDFAFATFQRVQLRFLVVVQVVDPTRRNFFVRTFVEIDRCLSSFVFALNDIIVIVTVDRRWDRTNVVVFKMALRTFNRQKQDEAQN
jgi:hypothetical protein